MSTTYLCGGINGLTDDQCTSWREKAKSLLLGDTLDPMRRDYRGKEAESVNEIVEGDLKDIALANSVLVNAERPSWGTAMEIVYSHSFCITSPIFVVCPSDQVSPWLRYHATGGVFKTLEEACEAINNKTAPKVMTKGAE